ncbi:MAG TPA: hypothetical protein VKW06_04590 [Candidatus Angelobacter sp.]|nr:hypothetical protein [Candidatus Angelobacter sp.]
MISAAKPAAILLVCVSLALAAQAGDKKKTRFFLKPDQTADLRSTKLATGKQSCQNWGLAAGIESMLSRQEVALDQTFWIMRLNHGELCEDRLPSMEQLSQVVNQDFVLDDGRHVRLELHWVPGAPTDIDSVLLGLKQDRPALLLLRGHPYYLVGATYDEHIRGDGLRLYEIKELRLLDTLPGRPAITFQKGRDNMDEINGILTVIATQL